MCKAQSSVVSYVAMQARTILGNAAIDGSVYNVSLEIIIMPLRHAVKMPLEYVC